MCINIYVYIYNASVLESLFQSRYTVSLDIRKNISETNLKVRSILAMELDGAISPDIIVLIVLLLTFCVE